MRFLLVLSILWNSLFLIAQPPGYGFGKQILVDPTQVSGSIDFSGFVLLVSLTDPDLRTIANSGNVANTNGFDIIFTDADCNTQLLHQIERYNPATGEFIAWVRIPTLFATASTNFHMYYGNATVVADPSTTAVWGPEYAAVWHMNQSPAGAAPQLTDYTSNTNNGTANGGMVAGDLVAGRIGNAIDFDGNNDFFDCGANASTNPSGSLTVSAWVFSRAASGHIINRGGGWDDPGYSLFRHNDRIRIELQRTGEKDIVDNLIARNQWHYVALTYDNTTGTIRCFINGVQQGNTGTHTGPIGMPVENLNIARKEQNAFYYNGIIDEGRVIHTNRSADWLRTEFNNQNSPATFYAVSPEMPANTLCVLLPIELIDFQAKLEDEHVNLTWQTASETNNDFFTIERTNDEFIWEEIGVINGAGNSSSLLNYSLLDTRPLKGISYYRLKQTDFDGHFEYSDIQSVRYGDESLQFFPNPVESKLTILGSIEEVSTVYIYNSVGQDVTHFTNQVVDNSEKRVIDFTALETGVYFVKTKTKTTKIHKL